MKNQRKGPVTEENRPLKVSIGYASFAAGGGECEDGEKTEQPCGDTAVSCYLPGGSRAVILSDGMGHGTAAAAESRTAANILRRLLKQGMPVTRAIHEVNRRLVKEGKETFVTLDLMILDPAAGRARFYKLAAAPSYVLRDGQLRKVEQPALPVGILPALQLTHVSARLSEGAVIIMMSDGICDSGRKRSPQKEGTGKSEIFPEEESEAGTEVGAGIEAEVGEERETDWVKTYIKSLLDDANGGGRVTGSGTTGGGRRPGPRQLAFQLLEEARRRYGDDETDDATVVAVMMK